MRNITVSVSDEVARWASVWSAEHDTSISAMVSQTLQELMESEKGYKQKMTNFLAKKPKNLSGAQEYPARESLHER